MTGGLACCTRERFLTEDRDPTLQCADGLLGVKRTGRCNDDAVQVLGQQLVQGVDYAGRHQAVGRSRVLRTHIGDSDNIRYTALHHSL